MKKNNLDEMQEQKLLQIEHTGFWLTFTCLLIAIMVQGILGAGFFGILGETLSLLVVSIYVAVSCTKNGIWDRRFKPDSKTNLLFSLAAGIFIAIFTYFHIASRVETSWYAVIACLIAAAFVFSLCFAALSLCAVLYKKRRKKLDEE